MITFNGDAGRKDDFVDVATYLIYHTKKTVIKHTPLTNNNNSHYNNLNYIFIKNDSNSTLQNINVNGVKIGKIANKKSSKRIF